MFTRDASYLWSTANEGKTKKESNSQPIFWSRGNGWAMGGFVQILQELPSNHPTRPFYIKLLQEMSASLLAPAAYPGGETSGSGFDTYALA